MGCRVPHGAFGVRRGVVRHPCVLWGLGIRMASFVSSTGNSIHGPLLAFVAWSTSCLRLICWYLSAGRSTQELGARVVVLGQVRVHSLQEFVGVSHMDLDRALAPALSATIPRANDYRVHTAGTNCLLQLYKKCFSSIKIRRSPTLTLSDYHHVKL